MGGFFKKYTLKKKSHKTQEYLPLGKMNLNNYALRTYPALVYRSQYLQGNYCSLTFPLKQTNKQKICQLTQSFLVILFGTDSITVRTSLEK